MKERKTDRIYGEKVGIVIAMAKAKWIVSRTDFPWPRVYANATLNQMVRRGHLRVVRRGDIGRHTKNSENTTYEGVERAISRV